MDGTLRIVDESGGALPTEGHVSEALSEADSRFEDPPVLALKFETPVSVPALIFRFDQVAEEWCTALTMTAWKDGQQMMQRQVLSKAVEHRKTVQIDRFDWLEIRFVVTSQLFRRAHDSADVRHEVGVRLGRVDRGGIDHGGGPHRLQAAHRGVQLLGGECEPAHR